jgi:nicotinate-nucleotide pyrophosphorylase (carboxylating)
MTKLELLQTALKEDIGRGDLFSKVAPSKDIEAKIVAKSDGILAGREYIEEFKNIDSSIMIEFLLCDGDSFKKGDKIASIKGDSNKILSYERVILNLLQHSSGIATNTYEYVKLIDGYDMKLLDTRKTRPALRELEKYAVRCGGGVNHRLGLDDCLMLKDTHVATIDDLKAFMKEVRKEIPWTSKVEIECESFEQVERACEAGADIIMCDNMSYDEIKEVVKFRDKNYPHILLEASGNVTKKNLLKYAKTGVDAISSGSLIHQAVWVDFSMKVVS